nr:zinc finger, CCHC-type [Tanacetum cinerariifolium]
MSSAFLANNRDTIISAVASQEIPTPATFQNDDLDAFDSDCDDGPLAKAILMANLSSYDSNFLSEKQLSIEQAYWLPISQPVVVKPPIPSEPVLKKEIDVGLMKRLVRHGIILKISHGFLELHQIDTFNNALTQSDQDSLNATAGGNLLNRTPRDALTIIENKSKVHTLRNKPIVSKVSTTTSSQSPSSDVTALTEIVNELVLMNNDTQQATVKAIEETCMTYRGPHPYYECLATGGNTFDGCATVGTYNQGGTLNSTITSSLPKEVERESEVTRDKVETTSSESTTHVQPPVVQVPIPEPDVAPKPNLKRSIPYPSRLNDQKLLNYNVDPRVPLILGRPFLTTGDILYLEKLLNEDPSLNLPSMKNEDLKQVDVSMTKPSIEEPPELELKDLPPRLEYAFLEGTDKLPLRISKELKDEEKAVLLKTPPPPKKDNPAKDTICHQCGEVGHWRRNCPVYLAELMKKKKLSQGANTLSIFTIELYSFPSKSWIFDTGCVDYYHVPCSYVMIPLPFKD